MKTGGIMWNSSAIPIPIEFLKTPTAQKVIPSTGAVLLSRRVGSTRFTAGSQRNGSCSFRTATSNMVRQLRHRPNGRDRGTLCRSGSSATNERGRQQRRPLRLRRLNHRLKSSSFFATECKREDKTPAPDPASSENSHCGLHVIVTATMTKN
jgi:hypothetical protein